MQARLLYRDGLMLVIDKPAGVAVHRGPKGGANLIGRLLLCYERQFMVAPTTLCQKVARQVILMQPLVHHDDRAPRGIVKARSDHLMVSLLYAFALSVGSSALSQT